MKARKGIQTDLHRNHLQESTTDGNSEMIYMTDITELKGKTGLGKKHEGLVLKVLEEVYKDLEHLALANRADLAFDLTSHGLDEEVVTDDLIEKILIEAQEIIEGKEFDEKDAEAEKKGLASKRRAKVPFKERFRLPMLSGQKTCTTRPYKIGNPRDEFEAFGVVFEILEVEELPLGQIAKKRYAAEGFESPEEFITFWLKIHPHEKYDPLRTAFSHTFKLISIPTVQPKGSEATPSEPSQKETKTKGRKSGKGRRVEMACYECRFMYGSYTDENESGMISCAKNGEVKPRKICKDLGPAAKEDAAKIGEHVRTEDGREITVYPFAPGTPPPAKTEDETPPSKTKKGSSGSTSLINQAQKTLDMDWTKMHKNYTLRTCFVPLSLIQENDFNPNVMTEEDEGALLLSMMEQGPENTPPIIVMESKAYPGYVIIDGAHRYRMARVLSWNKMLITIRHDIDELAAMSLCWKMNARRGHLDWFREALMFSTLSKKGKSHEEIADLLTVKVPYVQTRISILVIGEENIKKAQEMGISLSALVEVAAIRDPVARDYALDQLLAGEVKTMEEVKEITTKKRTCPECGKEAGKEKYVKCPDGHYFPIKKPKGEKKVVAGTSSVMSEEEKKRLQKEFPHANLEQKDGKKDAEKIQEKEIAEDELGEAAHAAKRKKKGQ